MMTSMMTNRNRNKSQLKKHQPKPSLNKIKIKENPNKVKIKVKSLNSIITKVVNNKEEIKIGKTKANKEAITTLRTTTEIKEETRTGRTKDNKEVTTTGRITTIKEVNPLTKEENLSTKIEVIFPYLNTPFIY